MRKALISLGFELIESDFKRKNIKKYQDSIKEDLKDVFQIRANLYKEHGQTSDCRVCFDGPNIHGFEAKVGVSCYKLVPQSGCRLWYCILVETDNIFYLPIILFDCREEQQPKYKKRPLTDAFWARLKFYREQSENCPKSFKL